MKNVSNTIIYPTQAEQLNLLISFFLQYYLKITSKEVVTESHPITDLFFNRQALRMYFASEYKSAPIELSQELKEKIDEMLMIKKLSLPPGLQANLRPYQE